MGGIWLTGHGFWQGFSEGVGFKTGVALGREELARLLREGGFSDLADLPDDDTHGCRLHSSEYEEVFTFALYKLGRLERDRRPFPAIDLHHKYKRDAKKYKIAMAVVDRFLSFAKARRGSDESGPMDVTPFVLEMMREFGSFGGQIAMEFVGSLQAALVANPWSEVRDVEWADEVALKELFDSERLMAPAGPFIDQRYIDFLHRNFDRIDEIHWRKFEGLTAEFFQREGYEVELGPGRNDGGVDVRIWTEKPGTGQPPNIIAQCKRQKAPVDKVILKALYADVAAEGADSGLIVTTSRLSIGAREVKRARAYPIQEADRDTLREWLSNLRRPGAGFVP